MPETLSVRPRICQQIRSGPLGQWIDDFVDVLTTRGVRNQRRTASRPSRGGLQCVARAAAGRGNRDR